MSTDLAPAPVPLRVTLDAACLKHLRESLQRGVTVPARVPCTVAAFLVGQLGVEPAYVEQRISSMFLDGQVVDDPEAAVIREGSILALSAALPGLVGATLRKGGYYAAMRSDITLAPEDAAGGEPAGSGAIRLKLFNLVLEELAPAVLGRGILLPHDEAVALLEALGRPVDPPPPGAPALLVAAPPP
ncbi:MAG TPA: hypothetical protein VFP65_07675 [Anaeromyxobacteraceae bacterium]|nr:hypothetical protein [Anaeromyxobacteraceae bacterium]